MRLDAETVEIIETENEDIIQAQYITEDRLELSIFDNFRRVSVVELNQEEISELIELLEEYKEEEEY